MKNIENDSEPITREWLRTTSGTIGMQKRLCYEWFADGVSIYASPECGDYPPILGVNKTMVFRNPTKGDLRRLLLAFNINIEK